MPKSLDVRTQEPTQEDLVKFQSQTLIMLWDQPDGQNTAYLLALGAGLHARGADPTKCEASQRLLDAITLLMTNGDLSIGQIGASMYGWYLDGINANVTGQ